MRRHQDGERGTVLMLVSLVMVLMLLMVAFALDLGNGRQSRERAQSTADAAALAGAGAYAKFSGDLPTVTNAKLRAAQWAFNNLGMSVPTGVACGGNTTCYSAGDAKNTVVEVTTPYTSTRTQPDGTPYTSSELVHVETCWDVETTFAAVIGMSTIHVCGESTARGLAPVGVNSDYQDELNDPYARCAVENEGAIFDTSHWFPSNRDVHDGTTFGGTYLFSSDLDKTSVVFTVDGVDYTFPGVVTPARSTDSSMVQISQKAAPAGMYKYEIKFNKLGSKAALGNGLHTVALYAAAVNAKCYQSIWTFTINNAPVASGSACKEDLFRGGQNPGRGTTLSPGGVVSATYYDETPLYTYSGTDPGSLSRNLIFNLDPANNPGGLPSAAANVPITTVLTDTQNPPPGTAYRYDFAGNGKGEYKYGTKLWYTMPASLFSGPHTIYLRAYDSDQNKNGGDCGIAEWTINYTGGAERAGSVELVD